MKRLNKVRTVYDQARELTKRVDKDKRMKAVSRNVVGSDKTLMNLGHGWCKLPRNAMLRLNCNKFITDLNKMFKDHPQLVEKDDNGETITIIGAIRSDPITKHRGRGLATEGTTSAHIMHNKIDLSDLCPATVNQLLAATTSGRCGLKKCNDLPISHYTEFKHEHLIPANSYDDDFEEMEFIDSDNIKNKPVVEIVARRYEDCTKQVMTALAKELKKFGGFDGYLELHKAKHSPDYNVYRKEDPETFTMDQGLFNPIKKCGVCSELNYLKLDRAMKQVHYSLAKYRRRSKAIQEDYFTIRNTKDIRLSVPWRCGKCFTDLNLLLITREDFKVTHESIIIKYMFLLFGDIEQLMKLGYGDTYDDLEADEKRNIKDQDLKTINDYFFHLQRRIVPVGQDFNQYMSQTLGKHLPSNHYRPMSRLNSIKPEFIAEVSCLTEHLYNIYSDRQLVILGDILPGRSQKNVHQWYHNDFFFQDNYNANCSEKGVCSHDQNFFLVGSLGALELPLATIIPLVDQQRTLQMIIPIKTEANTLADSTGKYYKDHSTATLFFDGNPNGFVINSETFDVLHNYNVMVMEDNYYFIFTTKTLELVKLVTITGPYTSTRTLPRLIVDNTKNRTFTLMLPNIDNFMGKITGLNFSNFTVKLDPSLFRYLCLRNFSGQLSHDTLRSYAVGFSLRRFVMHNRVIANPTVAYDDIDMHIILSRVCMMKLKGNFYHSFTFADTSKLLGPFRGLIGEAESALTSCLINAIFEKLLAGIGLDKNIVFELLNRSALKMFIDGVMKNDFWADLINMSQEITVIKPKVIDVSRPIPNDINTFLTQCDHHGKDCHHQELSSSKSCMCCNMRIAEGKFCGCCKPRNDGHKTFFQYSKWLEEIDQEEQPAKKHPIPKTKINEAESILRDATRLTQLATGRRQTPPCASEVPGGEMPENDKDTFYDLPAASADDTPVSTATHEPDVHQDAGASNPDVIEYTGLPTSQIGWKQVLNRAGRKLIHKTETILRPIIDKVTENQGEIKDSEIIQKLGFDFLRHVDDPVVFENELNDDNSNEYQLPHTLMGITILDRSAFNVVECTLIQNSIDQACGFEAYKYGMTVPIEYEDFKQLVGKEPPFSQHDLMEVAKLLSHNIIMIDNQKIYITRNNDTSDSFRCILFKEATDGSEIGHFSPCQIKRVSRANQYFAHKNPNSVSDREAICKMRLGSGFSLLNPSIMTSHENKVCELSYALTLESETSERISTPLVLVHLGSDHYITNNPDLAIHNPQRDRIHIKLPDHIRDLSGKIQACLTLNITGKDLPVNRHVSKELPNSMATAVHDEVLEALRSMARVIDACKELTSDKIKQVLNGVIQPWFSYSKFIPERTANHKLKKYDLITIKIDKISVPCFVIGFDKNGLILDRQFIVSRRCKLYEPKESYGSKVRELVGYCRPTLTMQQVKEKFLQTKMVTGPAGFGKSTIIGKKAKVGDMCVAMTSSAVSSLKEKLEKGVMIQSLERAFFNHMGTSGTLFVDEATMVNWVQIAVMLEPQTVLELYGATNQIGRKDMSQTPGVRHVISIMDCLDKNNITNHLSTYRIGQPMATLLEAIEPKLQSRAPHRTTFTITCIEDHELDNIANLIKKSHPDVIITPYNHNKERLIKLIGPDGPSVVTTHSFQGVEVARSMVVLRPDVTGRWDLNGQPEYLNSALTRAKYHTDILVVGYITNRVASLNDLLVRVGALNVNVLGHTAEIRSPESIPNDLNRYSLPNPLTINTMHKLNQEHIDLLNGLKISFKGVDLEYKRQGDQVSVVGRKFGATLFNVSNNGGVVAITAPEWLREKINKNLDQPLDYQQILTTNLGIEMDEHWYQFTAVAANKIKELCWVLDKTVEGQLTTNLLGCTVTFKKDSGCPLMSGLEISSGGERLKISNGWYSLTKRLIWVDKPCHYANLTPIIKWLDIQIDGLITSDVHDIGWLSVFRGDMVHVYWHFKERLTQVKLWFLNYLFGELEGRCNFNNIENTVKYNEFSVALGLDIIKNHQSVISNHKTLILKKNCGWLRKTERIYLASHGGVVDDIHLSSNESQWIKFMQDALVDIKYDGKIRGINIADLEIPGLLMDLPKHFASGTQVRQFVTSWVSKIHMATAPGVHDVVRLNREGIDKYRHMMLEAYPKLKVARCNYILPVSEPELALEQLMINMHGKISKASTKFILYGGSAPMAIAIQGKYYIKVRIPEPGEQLQVHYHAQLPELHNLISQANSNMKRDQDNKYEVIWDSQSRPEKVLLGTSIITYSYNKLKSILENTNYIIGWVPIKIRTSEIFTISDNGKYVSYAGGKFTMRTRNELMDDVQTCQPVMIDSERNTYGDITVLTEFMDHRLIKIETKMIPETRYLTRRLGSRQDLVGHFNVTVPWIDFDIARIISEEQILTHKTLTINRKLLRNIMLRLMTGDDSVSSALAYARTIESTQLITDQSIQDLGSANLHITLSTTWYAIYLHKGYLNKFKLLIKLINMGVDNQVVLALIESILPGLLELVGKASIQTTDLAARLVSKLNDRLNLTNSTLSMIEAAEKLNWAVIPNTAKINRYYFETDEDVCKAWLDAGKDYEDEDINEDDAEPEEFQSCIDTSDDEDDGDDDNPGNDTRGNNGGTEYNNEPKETGCNEPKGADDDNTDTTKDHRNDAAIVSEQLDPESSDEDSMSMPELEDIPSSEDEDYLDTTRDPIPDGASTHDKSPTSTSNWGEQIKHDPECHQTSANNEPTQINEGLRSTHNLQDLSDIQILSCMRILENFCTSNISYSHYYDDRSHNALLSELMIKSAALTIIPESTECSIVEFLKICIGYAAKKGYDLGALELNHTIQKLIGAKLISSNPHGDNSPTTSITYRSIGRTEFVKGKYHIIPKIIWAYQLKLKIEPFHRSVLTTLQHLHPQYKVIVITTNDMAGVLNQGEHDKFMKLNPESQANIVKYLMLATYGGVWVDCNSITLRPLDDIVEATSNNPDGFALCESNLVNGTKQLLPWVCVSNAMNPVTIIAAVIYKQLLKGTVVADMDWSTLKSRHHWLLADNEGCLASTRDLDINAIIINLLISKLGTMVNVVKAATDVNHELVDRSALQWLGFNHDCTQIPVTELLPGVVVLQATHVVRQLIEAAMSYKIQINPQSILGIVHTASYGELNVHHINKAAIELVESTSGSIKDMSVYCSEFDLKSFANGGFNQPEMRKDQIMNAIIAKSNMKIDHLDITSYFNVTKATWAHLQLIRPHYWLLGVLNGLLACNADEFYNSDLISQGQLITNTINLILTVSKSHKLTHTTDLVGNRNKPPPRVIDYIRAGVCIPQIIWTFWHEPEVPSLVRCMINTWHEHCPSHRIVVLTNETIRRMVSEHKFILLMKQTKQFASDWIRLYVLKTFGGVWLDASSIVTQSLEPYLVRTCQHNSHLFQVSLSSKSDSIKSYESWLIICSRSNKLVTEWFKITDKMMESCNPDGQDSLQWMASNYSDEYSSVVGAIVPNLRVYLRLYLAEMIAINIVGMEPLAVHPDAGRVTLFHDLPLKDWLNLWGVYGHTTLERHKLTLPVVKLIGVVRKTLITQFANKQPIQPGSYLSACIEAPSVDYDVYDLRNITIESIKTFQDSMDMKVDKFKNCNILMVFLGSKGDVAQGITLYDLIEAYAESPIIITHIDHKTIVDRRRAHFISTTSDKLMQAYHESSTSSLPTTNIKAAYLLNQIKNQVEEITGLYDPTQVRVIFNSATPGLTGFLKQSSRINLMIDTFPIQWAFLKPQELHPSVTEYLIGSVKGFIYNTMFDDYSIMIKEGKTRQALTCLPAMIPESHTINFIGPLTSPRLCPIDNQTMTTKELTLVTFGSCDKMCSNVDLENVLSTLLQYTKSVIYVDNSNRVILGTNLYRFFDEHKGELLLTTNYDAVNLNNVKSMICHGGHGTLQDALFNHIPLFVIPFIADQFYWAAQVKTIQIGHHSDLKTFSKEVPMFYAKQSIFKKNLETLKTNTRSDMSKLLMWMEPRVLNDTVPMVVRTLWMPANTVKYQQPKLDEMVGIVWLVDVTYTVNFDPTGAEYCVKQSIADQLVGSSIEVFQTSTCPSIMQLHQSGVSEQDLIDGVLSLGFNICIIYKDGTGTLIKPYNTATISILIDESQIVKHAKSIMIINAQRRSSQPHTAIADNLISPDLNNLVHNCLHDYGLIPLTNPYMLIKAKGNKAYKNLLARMNSSNLGHLANRSDIHVKFIKVRRSHNLLYCDTEHTNRGLSLGLVMAIDGWKPCSWLIANQRMIIFTYSELKFTTVFINLHIQLSDCIIKRPQVVSGPRMVSLNPQTVSTTMGMGLSPRTNDVINIYDFGYHLIIADYDNRSHHNGDLIHSIRRATKITIHCVPPCDVQELYDSHDRPYDRVIIVKNYKRYAIEFVEIVDALSYNNITKCGTRIKNLIHCEKPLVVEHLNLLTKLTINNGKQLIYKDRWPSSAIGIVVKRQVLDVIETSVIIDAETFSAINSALINYSDTVSVEILTGEVPSPWDGNLVSISRDVIHLLNYPVVIRNNKLGGNNILQRNSWKIDSTNNHINQSDWWGIQSKSYRMSGYSYKDTMAINNLLIHEPTTNNTVGGVYSPVMDGLDMYIPPLQPNYTGALIEPLYDLPSAAAMQLWDDNDLTDWLNLYAPKNQTKVYSREQIGEIIKSEKITMERYPIQSRPVLTKVCFEEGRSILGRIKSVVNIRTATPNPFQLIYDMCNTYFCAEWYSLVSNYRNNRLIIDPDDVKQWVEENKDCDNIVKDLIEWLAGDMLVKPISDVKIHLKLESLLKANPTSVMKQQQARIIVWQSKVICSLYSKVFVKCKARLKEILHHIIIYADGLRPDELSARVRLVHNVIGFFENDLTKQDRQTDKPIIDVELMMYDLLGVHPDVLASWREVHEMWRFKSTNYWGYGEAMRLTGQATTAIGNCLTNMQVHTKFVQNNKPYLRLALFLGDDMCMLFSRKPDLSNLRHDIATNFNMQSKDSWTSNGATFCSMVLSRLPEGRAELAPDVVRLKFRYEVTNGVHEATDENIIMRKMSYLMMLGQGPLVAPLVNRLQLPIKPVAWYDYDHMLQAVACKYNMTDMQVEGYYHKLLHCIEEGKLYRYHFRHFSNRVSRQERGKDH